ncbi:TRAP transporter small permease subunit [Aquicoccus sp. SCR17]|nr:TRAP transporter small permease subunit [Carideicomes alvinocaridis]
MRDFIWRWADRLVSLSAFVGTLGLLAEVLVIVVDVIGRYFGAPLRGAQDVTQMSMVLVVFGGMAICDRLNGHINIDLFERAMPAWMLRAGDVIAPLLGAVVFAGIAWTVWESAALSRMLNLATNILYLPKAWFQYFVVVMSLITALAMLLRALDSALGKRSPDYE